DREIESSLHAMVKHDRVQHFAPGIRQAKRNVRDSENGLASRQRGLDHPNSLDSLDGRTNIVAVAGPDREDEQVKENVFGLYAVILNEQLERTLRDLQFAVASDRLCLLLVLVDASDHQRGTVLAGDRHDAPKTLFAVFEVDRIDNRFAGSALQR